MPQERPRIPPERKPVSEFPTPSPAVVIFSELVNRTDPAYVQNAPVARGTLYSSIVGGSQDVSNTYPTLYFLKERKLGQSDQLVLWDWASVPDAEDTYNAEVNYVSNAVPYPAFNRVYTIRRDDYEDNPTLVVGSTLTALIGVNITDGGQDYTFATGSINNTDVAIEFVVSQGVIQSGVITNEGTGILSTSTITIDGDGLGAVAIPIVQPTTCFLTTQKKQELAQDDPLRNEFVRVIRTYETLPGPFIATTRIDDDGKVVTVNSRRNIAANIVSGETITTVTPCVNETWTKTSKKGDDNFVGEENVESRVIPGNPIPSVTINNDGDTVNATRTLKKTTCITAGEAFSGNCTSGTWTKTSIKEVSDLVSYEIVESVHVPGNQVETTRFRSDGSTIVILRTLKNTTCITPGGSEGGGILVLTRIEDAGSDIVSYEVKEQSSVPGPPVHGEHIDDTYELVVDITKTIVPDGTNPSPNPAVDGTFYEIKPHDEWQSVQIASKLDPTSLPADVQWFGGQTHSFPPELVTGFDPIANPYGAIILWADATCGCKERFSAVLQTNFFQYSGVVKARYTEQFFYDGSTMPIPDDVTITQFFPQSHTFGFAFASVCGCGSGDSGSITAIAPQFRIPLCIHDTFTLCVGNPLPAPSCAGAPFSWIFPATSPAALPHGSYIMLPPHVERWRFRVWRRVLTEVLVP